MAAEFSDINKYLKAMTDIHEQWKQLWTDITDYVLQRRSFWDKDGSQEGKRPSTKIYDGSALAALQLLVDGLVGYLVSPKIKWFRLQMKNRELNDIPGVADWLEEVEDVLYAEFARSNFYEAMSEFFLDAASIGTSAMLVEDDVAERRTLFTTMHIKEYRIAEARTGLVDTLFRDFQLTNRKIVQTWGDEAGFNRKQDARNAPYNKARIVHAVYPRSDRDYMQSTGPNKPWASEYWDMKYKTIIHEGGYDSFPYLVWRWRKNTDETYGRSPAADAINDIMRLNQMGKTSLMAAQLAVQPPMNIPMNQKGLEKLIPHGSNYFTKSDEIISPINMGTNWQIGKEEELEIREQIRDIFRSKIFTLMEQLEGGNKTATEVREIKGEQAAVLGSTIGRLNSEVLIPLIDRQYSISDRNQALPPAPAELEGGQLKVEFMGPLAEAQKRYHESQGVIASASFAAEMAQTFPESLDVVDGDELMRSGMNSQGAPQKTIRENPDIENIRVTRQEEAARQEQLAAGLEQQKMVAGNVDQLNQPVNPDGMLAGIAGAAGQK